MLKGRSPLASRIWEDNIKTDIN